MPPADDPVASCLAAVRSSSQAERAAQLKAMLAETEASTAAPPPASAAGTARPPLSRRLTSSFLKKRKEEKEGVEEVRL